jgi:hypothetical protein
LQKNLNGLTIGRIAMSGMSAAQAVKNKSSKIKYSGTSRLALLSGEPGLSS